LPANVAKAAALVEIAVIAVSDRVEEEADEADHAMVVEEASAVEAVEEHHATTATSPVTSLAIARSLELRRATTVARTATFLASAMLLIAVDPEVVAAVVDRTEADVVAIATAVANLDTFLANAPRVAVETRVTIASAMLAEASATFRVTALKAPTVLEEKMVTTKSTTDSRST